MTSRSHRILAGSAAAAVTTAALLAATGATTAVAYPRAAAVHPSAVSAKATASPWTTLSSGAGVNISFQPSVVRWGRQLIVVWPQKSGSGQAIRSRILGATGTPASAVRTAVTWSSVSSDPRVILLGGVPTIVFNGNRTDITTDPYTGPMAYAQSPTATAWSLGAGSLSHDSAEYGLGAVDDGTGQPLVAFAGSSSAHVTFHHGIDPAVPAAADSVTGDTGSVQDVGVARDPKTGAVYALWYSGSSNPAIQGIHSAQVLPSLGAPSAPAPLSTVTYLGAKTSVSPGQDVSVTGRVGGGVWAAYPSGYPSAHTVVLWNVETGRTLTLSRPAGAVQYVGISAAPGGRVWVWWAENGAVYAVRTNPAVTRFGVVRRVLAPGGYSPTRTAGDGALGFLDVVINQSNNGAPSAISTTRIYEVPLVTARRSGATVTVTVSDAGLPVAGASVRVGGVTKRTGATGTVSFAAGAKGTHAVAVSAAGFAAAATSYRV
ncbi:MAG: hypothetical protein QOF57_2759 [Frankiaceae bacterium]|jgi:hypothetical protein|nr:hypothetical protein [Frankiaceae bacterium]